MEDFMSSQNVTLQFFQELEVLFKAIQFGTINMELEVARSQPRIVVFNGEKTHLYNRSPQDQNNNLKCFEDVIKRIQHSITTGDRSDIDFSIEVDKGKVKKLKWQTKTQKPVKT